VIDGRPSAFALPNESVFRLFIVKAPVVGGVTPAFDVKFPRPVKLLSRKTRPAPLLVILVNFDASAHTLRFGILVGVNTLV
jgi:hypothetical protein